MMGKNELAYLSERHKRLIEITDMDNMLQEAWQSNEQDNLMKIQDEDERDLAHVNYRIKYFS